MKQRPLPWSERDFEQWFIRNPFLPDGKRVLVIGRQRPLHRVVDLLALDATGGLLIIEVKNERSTRAVIGQSLEYLAQYVDAAAEDLEDEYSRLKPTSSLLADFRRTFKRKLTVAPGRRVYLVAPSFDFHSALCVRYLAGQLLGGKVEYHLLKAWRVAHSFRIRPYECPTFTRAQNLPQGFGVTPGGRLYYVLEPGRQPVMWYIGKRVAEKGLRPAPRRALRRTLQVVTRMLIPEKPAEEVDVSQSGTVWQRRKKAATSAKLIGQVLAGQSGRQRSP